MSETKLSVIIPVYNERATVLEILQRVRDLPVDKEVIIIDNCSTDGTREILQSLQYGDVKVVLQPRNYQKGNSVKRGLALAQGEFCVIQDGDLEYDPKDILLLLQAAEEPDVLAAFGSRILGARQRHDPLTRTIYRLGAGVVNKCFQVLFRSDLTDVATCYKLAPTKVMQSLALCCDGFDLDYEIAAKLHMLARSDNLRIVELPISYAPRTVAQGKKIRARDGLRALLTLGRIRLGRMRPCPLPME